MNMFFGIFSIVWVMVCPICEDKVTTNGILWDFDKDKISEYRNLIECPRCHIALFASVEKWGYVGQEGKE